MRAKRQIPHNETDIIALCQSHLEQVLKVHGELFSQMLLEVATPSAELAELFEDAGNLYLNVSEEITSRRRASRQTLMSAREPTRTPAPY